MHQHLLACILCMMTAGALTAQDKPAHIYLGQDIAATKTIMAALGNGDPIMEILSVKQELGMHMWPCKEGSVVATYHKKTKKVLSLDLYLMDDRPKSTRKSFIFSITSFTPRTGEMLIIVPNKAKQKPLK